MSVISACSRIKYCIIDNPDIKTWHGPPLSAVTKRSNIYIFLLSSPQSPASEGNTECLQAIWDRKETAVNSVLWRRTVNHLLIRTLCGLVTGNCPLEALLVEKSGVWWSHNHHLIFLSQQRPQLTTNKTKPGLNTEHWTVRKETSIVPAAVSNPFILSCKLSYHFTGWLSGWLAQGSRNVIAIWFKGRRSACWLMRVRWRRTSGPPTSPVQSVLHFISSCLLCSQLAHTGRCWSHWKMIRQSHRAVLSCTEL